MTQLNALPTTTQAWEKYLSQTFKIVDDALSTVVFSRNKCQLIANEMARFYRKLLKNNSPALSTREIMRLFEFVKATAAFVGLVSSYQSNSWLPFFLNSEPNQSYSDLSNLWAAWSDCATAFTMNAFEDSDALAFAHSKDLVAVYSTLVTGFNDLPKTVQDIARMKLEEIQNIIRPPKYNGTPNEVNKNILKPTDWDIVTPNIGKGSCANVHLARLKSNGQEIAVKELLSAQLTPRRINYLKREINSLKHLTHPNLLNMVGVTINPPFCIASAYYPNGSLFEKIRQPSFTPQLAASVGLDVARALEYLHAQGMIHRDLKPSNILLDKENKAVVCDFCFTRMAAPLMSCELGTIQWMAPEILTQGGTYDNTIDVYAYGMILYELATRETPFANNRTMQVASIVMSGGRPDIPMAIPDSMANLIRRCWAQEPVNRPSMHQIVTELETGTIIFSGADAQEFRQYARKTSPQHRDAMESLTKQQSDVQTLISRLMNINPLDPLAIPTLQNILDQKIENPSVLKDVVTLATQTSSEEVAALSVKILEAMVQSEKLDADSLASGLLKLWESQPSFVVTNLKKVAKRLDNRQGFIKMILTQKNQNAQTVDAIEAMAELDDLPVVFEYLDQSLVVQTLSFALTRFGPVKEMVPAAVTSYPALSLLLRQVIKANKFQAIYLTDSDSTKVESIMTKMSGGFFMNNAKDLQFIIENLSVMLHKGGPGYVTLDLLNSGAKFQPVAQLISKMDFWSIIGHAFESERDDICNAALTLAQQLRFTEENIRQVWEPLLLCFTRTHSDVSIKLIQQFIKQVPKLDITGFIIGLISALESNKPEFYCQILFSINMNESICRFDKTFWRLVSKQIPNLNTASTASIALFALKCQNETQNNTVSYDFIGALLGFLYKQTAPFSCITPVLQEILNMSVQLEVSVFLIHHHFVQYLHQMPLRYPNEPRVTNILLQFSSVFEAASNTVKSKNG